MLTEILYHRDAPWTVGETKAERETRMRTDTCAPTFECYRDTHPGRVISIRPVESDLPSLRNMADKDRQVVVLDLDDERQGAASKTMKVMDGRLVPVTFDDRFGAVAVKLREQHTDPEQWELDEIERIEKAESDNTAALADYETATEEYSALIETFAREVIDANRFDLEAPDIPEAPQLPRLVDVGESSFDREANALAKALPPTVTHTGTGLYCVKKTPTKHDDVISNVPIVDNKVYLGIRGLGYFNAYIGGYTVNVTRSETRAIISHSDNYVVLDGDLTNWLEGDDLDIFDAWSTIQAALDQLFTDQGATTFTPSQYIRIFAGTYDENVIPNATLDPDETQGYTLVIEGDPADSRENIIIAASSGNESVYCDCDQLLLRHLTVAGTPTDALVEAGFGCDTAFVDDCVLTSTVTPRLFKGANSNHLVRLRDCVGTQGKTGANVYGFYAGVTPLSIIRCSLTGPNTSDGNYAWYGTDIHIEASTISTWKFASPSTLFQYATARFIGNTFYDVDNGVNVNDGMRGFVWLINNIWKDCTYVLYARYALPQEDSGQIGPTVVLRNNCFHGYTNFINRGTPSEMKTYAEVIAMNQVDAAGDLDATDPKLTDPGAGDFSLQTGSPCIHSGVGAGVLYDVKHNPLDPHHPDRGAVGTGIGPNIVYGS